MKSYTDIDQSKKLVEILPLESADMYYSNDYTEPKIITKYDISFAKVLYGSYNIRFLKFMETLLVGVLQPYWTY